MVRKIVSHLPPRHFDDWGAIAVLKTIYPEAEVEYVQPQQVPQDYMESNEIATVDVGGKCDPDDNKFDHHQNSSIPCSLTLVLQKFFPELSVLPATQVIDYIDRFGARAAADKGLLRLNREIDALRKVILLIEPDERTGEVFLQTLREHGCDYDTFVRKLYENLKTQGLTQEAEEKIKKLEEEYKEKVQKAKIVEKDGFKIAILEDTIAPNHYRFFSETGADILIEKNSMNSEQTSILCNSASPRYNRAVAYTDKIAENFKIVFRHKTGFIRVVEEKIEKVFSVIPE